MSIVVQVAVGRRMRPVDVVVFTTSVRDVLTTSSH